MRWRTLACGWLVLGPATALAQSSDTGSAATAQDEQAEASLFGTSDEAPGSLGLWGLHVSIFVDAYAAYQTGGGGTLSTVSGHRAFSGQGATLRAENGLSLAFLGFDAAYDAESWGVVANLRFGPAATIFHHQAKPESDLSFGIEYLTQAYVLYRPAAQLELDLGMFMSPFGVEALESWKNPNYTISALYVYGQPNWHMGLQAKWQLDSGFRLMALVVNGANNISETQQNAGLDQTPTVGGSVGYEVSPALSFVLGGLFAVDGDHNDDGGFDAFADFVTTLKVGSLTSSLNADYVFTRNGAPNGGNRHFWGESLTVGYRFNDIIGIAARGEYLRDDANYGDGDLWRLVTGTLTLDVEPIPRVPYLIVRWENRWERSNQRVFGKDSRGTADTADDTYGRHWFETVLGVVAAMSR